MNIQESFLDTLKLIILNHATIGVFYNKHYPNSKYTLSDILQEIFFVLQTGISWRNLRSHINWKSVYFHFQRFVLHDIFKTLYIHLRAKYLSNNKSNIQIIDSTFIANKFGKNNIARNIFFKNKNCNKVSLLTDVNGIPLSVLVNSGNVHDSSFLNDHINDFFIINQKRAKKHILLADKAYEGKNIRTNMNNFGYTLMIPKKKNSKTNYQFNKKLYKKRILIEHTFQKLKLFRRVSIRYDSLISTYFQFLFFAISFIIFKKL